MTVAKIVSKRHDRIRLALEAIRKAHGGRLTASAVLTAAKNEKHPLHREFIWNNAKAAHLQRLDRARELITTIEVVVVHTPVRIVAPAYVRDPRAAPSTQGHIALTSEDIVERDAISIMREEMARIEANVVRARGVAMLLARRFPDVPPKLELMLDEIVNLRGGLAAAA